MITCTGPSRFTICIRVVCTSFVLSCPPLPPAAPLPQVRPYNLEVIKTIRDLDPSDVDKLICVEGMVTRASPIIPDMRTAHFKCEKCGHCRDVANEAGKVEEPEKCGHCASKFTMQLVHNLSLFTNKQLVKMQVGRGAVVVVGCGGRCMCWGWVPMSCTHVSLAWEGREGGSMRWGRFQIWCEMC